MGVAGQGARSGLFGTLAEGPRERDKTRPDGDQPTAEMQAERRRDLVVTAPTCVNLGADRTGELGQTPLDRGVDVFVAVQKHKLARCQLAPDLTERRRQ